MTRERRDIPITEWRLKEGALISKRKQRHPPHQCDEHLEYVETDGALGQAWYCGVCGALIQVG